MTGDISVELLTAPPSPSGSGDMDHELATVLGPLTLEEDVAAYAAWESAPDAVTTMAAPNETMTKEASDAIANRKLGAAQRFVWLSFRLLPPAEWQLAICELLYVSPPGSAAWFHRCRCSGYVIHFFTSVNAR